MTVEVNVYADRDAVVTVRRSWLARLLWPAADPDPWIAVGDQHGWWRWDDGRRVRDARIAWALDRAQEAFEIRCEHESKMAWKRFWDANLPGGRT